MIRRLLISALAGLTALSALILSSSASSSDVTSRQANFKRLLLLDRSVRAELAKRDPDPAAIEQIALIEEKLARQIPGWFPPGSREENGTYARPEVWTNQADFRAKAAGLALGFASLAEAARNRQAGRSRSEEAWIGSRCQACHRSYVIRF